MDGIHSEARRVRDFLRCVRELCKAFSELLGQKASVLAADDRFHAGADGL